ncbi:MAG TPA: metalloregulator ArsR/SmtB family transcription factor [Planctomycetia bacterium]|nr:metalloregulator ArsR/SmtB family transcription factor [Planctomycetia bacterium]
MPALRDPWTAAAECLKVLAHPARLRIVETLLARRCTVGQLAAECDLPDHVASGHLRLLQRCGLLAPQREGRTVCYVVSDPCVKKLMACIRSKFQDAAE